MFCTLVRFIITCVANFLSHGNHKQLKRSRIFCDISLSKKILIDFQMNLKNASYNVLQGVRTMHASRGKKKAFHCFDFPSIIRDYLQGRKSAQSVSDCGDPVGPSIGSEFSRR